MTDQPWSGRRLHVLGIGGAGMSAYALAARALGAEVSGSDQADSPYAAKVREAGIEVAIGHAAEHVPSGASPARAAGPAPRARPSAAPATSWPAVELVVSSAIPDSNPELAAARERGIPIRSRADLLAELTALRRTIAVAGAHGKTTTSSMIAHILLATGHDPGYLIGGVLRSTGANGAWGTGEWLVVEADESDGSFLRLDVDVAVVTNVELDHHARWSSLDELREAFRAFLARPQSAVVWDRPDLTALRTPKPLVAYEPEHPVLADGGARFSWRGHEVRLAVPGLHNARNATAALEAAALAGADPAEAAAALAGFTGAGRRFERVGTTSSGALVIDDYAHHPTEVAATIDAARTLRGVGRVIAIFQPHLYSRTQELAQEFADALGRADEAIVVDVYPARESAEDFPGVSGTTIAQRGSDRVSSVTSFAQAAAALTAGEGDVVLVMGAGDVDRLAQELTAG